ncbi:hypothetical protein LWI29_028335 [Acer saccharum]|uniref:Uncharacterized protein n=1 Tax=Acer saccharum TaxID=4024 RepID=A0AA39TXF2_ACESA|nr:hypothetical protein LWI29_028335 [Acer saccharum]KAK1556594.1 hypothetical protein Q3G72_008410 [Acer saccharum]
MEKFKTSLRPSSSSSSSSFLKFKLFSSSTHLKKRPPTSNSRNEVPPKLDMLSVADQTSLDKFLNEKCRSDCCVLVYDVNVLKSLEALHNWRTCRIPQKVFMEFVVSLIQRGAAKDVEKSLFMSIVTGCCRIAINN